MKLTLQDVEITSRGERGSTLLYLGGSLWLPPSVTVAPGRYKSVVLSCHLFPARVERGGSVHTINGLVIDSLDTATK